MQMVHVDDADAEQGAGSRATGELEIRRRMSRPEIKLLQPACMHACGEENG